MATSTVLALGFVITMAILAACGGKDQTDSKNPPASTPPTPAVSDPAKPVDQTPPPKQTPPADPPQEAPKEPARPSTITKVVQAEVGRQLPVTLQTQVSTENEAAGQIFTARFDAPVEVGGAVAIPAGSTVKGEVTFADRAASVGGKARMTLEFKELTTADGKTRRIYAEPLSLEGEGTGSGDAQKVIGGAIGGAIIGGILGGREGALKGAAGGAAAGGVWAVATRGNDIVLEPGTKMMVTLVRAVDFTVTVPAMPS